MRNSSRIQCTTTGKRRSGAERSRRGYRGAGGSCRAGDEIATCVGGLTFSLEIDEGGVVKVQ